MNVQPHGAYGAHDGLVDYILGITFEIWEQGGIDLINQYYGEEATIFSLDGIVHGSAAMIDGTRNMLAAFPDRLLLADDVIWSGSREKGYYSSHRIISPMTNTGATRFGDATGKHVRVMAMADCVVEDGVITGEWLIRDSYPLVTQLGFEPIECARDVAEGRSAETLGWIDAEIERLSKRDVSSADNVPTASASDTQVFAQQVIEAAWATGNPATIAAAYAPYVVAHRSPIELYSGRDAIAGHYAGLRNAISVAGASVDHIAVQPGGDGCQNVAVRWTVAGTHSGDFLGMPASDKPVFVLGVTHWRIVGGRIAVEWTVFDSLGVMAQLV